MTLAITSQTTDKATARLEEKNANLAMKNGFLENEVEELHDFINENLIDFDPPGACDGYQVADQIIDQVLGSLDAIGRDQCVRRLLERLP